MENLISSDNLYKKDEYIIIAPYRSNSDIFDREKFEVEVIKKAGKKLVILTFKERKEGKWIPSYGKEAN
jgi:hypothetical protein